MPHTNKVRELCNQLDHVMSEDVWQIYSELHITDVPEDLLSNLSLALEQVDTALGDIDGWNECERD